VYACRPPAIIYSCQVALSPVELMESPGSTNGWKKNLCWPDLDTEERDSFCSNAEKEGVSA